MPLWSLLSTNGARICQATTSFTRTLVTTTTSTGVNRRVPPVLGKYETPKDFLKAIGRSAETKIPTENWAEFWKTSGQDLRKAGLAVKDRRYVLWCMEKYRNGLPIQAFAHEPTAKKTIRGWGPKVQNGKRIRSKRIKDKTKKKAL
ncbi:hypothetical protein FA15DRAFT_665714 [Coprinopsis marcescibilis]|uniref:Small ribosomal subunit protein mS41 n=1 Tax=Coprinopsis marcescibilis TaxID=230819 RepID=A0A5C3L774_COPMA|nr:hypothetical protein FA15DRAFT_665714 [Coprinopsis marcescibilis]